MGKAAGGRGEGERESKGGWEGGKEQVRTEVHTLLLSSPLTVDHFCNLSSN